MSADGAEIFDVLKQLPFSAASWQAPWVTDKFCNLKLLRHKTVQNQRTSKGREKISADLEPYEFLTSIDVHLT